MNEFSGLELQPDKSTVLEAVGKGSYPGQRVLERMGMGQSTIGKAIKAQLAIVAFNYVFTIISLMRQSSSTEQVHNKQKNVEGTSDKAAVVAERESKENLKAMKMFNKNGL